MNWNNEGYEIYHENANWLPVCTILEQVNFSEYTKFFGWMKKIEGGDDFTVAIWRKKQTICGENCGCADKSQCQFSNV